MKKLLALGAAVALGLSSIGCGEPAAPVTPPPSSVSTPGDASPPPADTPAETTPPADTPAETTPPADTPAETTPPADTPAEGTTPPATP